MVADGGVRRARQPPLADDGRDIGLGDPRARARQADARLRRRLVRRAAGRRRAEDSGRRVRGADDRRGARARRRPRRRARRSGARVRPPRARSRPLRRRVRRCARTGCRRRRASPTRCSGGSPRQQPTSASTTSASSSARPAGPGSFEHGHEPCERVRSPFPPGSGWPESSLVSVFVRAALAHRIVAPWIMIDEIVYSELAKSFAAHGHFLVRGVPSHGYGFVYPVLIAPAWRIFSSRPRRLRGGEGRSTRSSCRSPPCLRTSSRAGCSGALALIVAALTVTVPSMLYTGTLMTENAFYPVFLVCVLALVAMLERPTRVSQLLVLALGGVAYATRAQALALVPAILTAPLLYAPRRPAAVHVALRDGRRCGDRRVARDRRARPLAADAARRLPRRDDEQLLRRRRSSLHRLPPRRARPLSRRLPVRRADRALARTRSRPRVRRGHPARLRLSDDRGGGVRLAGIRGQDRGAQPLLCRSVRSDRAARSAAAQAGGVGGSGGGRRATGLRRLSALHQDLGGRRHLRVASLVVGAGPLDHARPGALGGARRVARRLCAFRAPSAPLHARSARSRRRVLRADHAHRRERPARDPSGRARQALGGHPRSPAELDRPGRRARTPR